MDIRNWALDRIMQLPDHCFGRRWPIIFSDLIIVSGEVFYISEMGLPDKCVLWELYVNCNIYFKHDVNAIDNYGTVQLSLGDTLPTTAAEFNALESMFPEADEAGHMIRWPLHLTGLRKLYAAQGRRVVCRVIPTVLLSAQFSIGLVFSSMPTEVPDWLCSARV